MKLELGEGTTQYGKGVQIDLSGDEVATAIVAYLVAHDIHIQGPRTIRVNYQLIECAGIYVDPSGFVISDGDKFNGRDKD